MNFKAILFDFDGVIIDSEPLHARAKQMTLEHFRLRWTPRLFSEYKGRPDSDFFQYVSVELAGGAFTPHELDAYKREVYLRLFENVPLVPGVLDFLAAARGQFGKTGLVTSATRRDFSLAARKYQLAQWFDVIINGEDTPRHKPDPEPYLHALTVLCASAAHTLVVEDSPNGVQAAKAAGCTAAALTTAFTSRELLSSGADLVVDSFGELAQILSA